MGWEGRKVLEVFSDGGGETAEGDSFCLASGSQT